MTVLADQIVQTARDWIGTPYRHQASVLGAGADCLGLVRGVWRTLYGREPEIVPAYSYDWSEVQGKERLWAAAARHLSEKEADVVSPGDLILFRMRKRAVAKHLGILVQLTPYPTFVHAYSGHGVVESMLSAPWRRRVVASFEFPREVG
ncbi:peptidase [Sulfitobacter sp. BDSS02]|nr:peptidase [Sulfitobacter sp. BDSS02]MBR9850414.1 peptidase [Paracoccaceae bacterium]